MKVYICGPMTGRPLNNVPAFLEAAELVRDAGHEPITPIQVNEKLGVDPRALVSREQYADLLLADLQELRKADGVLMLPGWADSRGATVEIAWARALGKPTLTAISQPLIRDRLQILERMVAAERGWE